MTDACGQQGCNADAAVDDDDLPYGYCRDHLPIVTAAYPPEPHP